MRTTIKSMAFVTALVTTVACSYSLAAQSAENYIYVRGGGGINWLQDADNTTAPKSESDFDRGFTLAGALGYRINRNFRVEGEVSYRENDSDSLTVTGEGKFSTDGDFTTWGAMFNLYLDVPIIEGSKFIPYIMGGLGYANIDADVSVSGTQLVDDDDSVFTYQAGAGLGYAIGENVTLDLEYRYFATEDPKFVDSAGDSFDSEYAAHSVTISVRYAFS